MTLCPKCNRDFSGVLPELAGKRVQCPCGHRLRLPAGLDSTLSGDQVSTSDPRVSKDPKSEPAPSSHRSATSRRSAIDFEYDDLDAILAGQGRADTDFHPAPQRAIPAIPVVQTNPTSQSAQPASQPAPAPKQSTKPRSLRRPASLRKPALAPPSEGLSAAQEPPARPTIDRRSSQGSITSGSIPESSVESAARSEMGHLGIGFVFSVVSAVLTLLFAFCLIAPRLVAYNRVPLQVISQPVSQIYTGNFGNEEISRGNRIGFMGLGWVITVTGLSLLGLAVFQIGGLVIQMFTHLRLFRWIDGAIAICAVVLIFSLVGTLFVHTAHLGHLRRELNQVVSTNDMIPESVTVLRKEYDHRQTSFIGFVLGTSGLAAGLFGLSVVRLWTSSKPHQQD